MKLYDDINNLDQEKEKYIKEYINRINQFKYVYLWGISESLDEAIIFFTKNNITIKAIIDGNAIKYGKKYKGINVIDQNFNNIDNNGAYVITCSYFETIRSKLIINNPDIDNNLFLFDGYFMENKDINYYLDNKNIILRCYNSLEDDYSKNLYNNLLKYRYIRDPKYIKDLYHSRSDCYLDKVFLDNYKNGLYIDAGSYNADFITTLKERKDISKSKFYIFEPNKYFYNDIKNNLDNTINYKIFDMALCDKDGEMEFMQVPSSTSHIIDKKYNAYNNTVLKNDIDIVKTAKLDTIIKEEKVNGIKIDIEGSEASMLNGSINTIINNKPILLISIYHRWDDLFKIQEFIMNLNLDYKFYIRHYSLSVAKTILYCIPKEVK